jgi:hypothetical protein
LQGPSSTYSEPGLLAAAAAAGTHLTLLSIDKCRVFDGPSGLAAVSALKSLRHLHLGEVRLPRSSCHDMIETTDFTFPSSLLSVLVHLTHLSLPTLRAPTAATSPQTCHVSSTAHASQD